MAVALIFNQALLLELSKMMPDRIERDSQSSGKLFGGQPFGQLQLGENRTANAAISKREREILRGGRGIHTAIISKIVGIVNLGTLLVRILFLLIYNDLGKLVGVCQWLESIRSSLSYYFRS